mgnify:CR=1 FL=1
MRIPGLTEPNTRLTDWVYNFDLMPTILDFCGKAIPEGIDGSSLRGVIESGGDNLASTFSLDLVDWWMFVIDVGQGDDIPRKRGPGILQCDLLVINKTDLAPHVGVDADLLARDAAKARGARPFVMASLREGCGVDEVVAFLKREGGL